jgi:hypothetical protein
VRWPIFFAIALCAETGSRIQTYMPRLDVE